jgi:hypothetical protein
LRALTVLALFAAGCNCGDSTIHTGGKGGGGGGSSGSGGGGGGASSAIVSIAVTPADQVLNLPLGTTQNVSYQAVATFADHTTGMVTGTFSVADVSIGTIEQVSGFFTASGIVGGVTQVIFTAGTGEKGQTSVTVNLSATFGDPDGGVGAQFTAAGAPVMDATAAATIVYPLDNVLFPQNINAPVVQWEGTAAAGDWFRVTYVKPNITLIDYVQDGANFTFSEALTDMAFSRVAETDPAAQGTVQVDRLDVTGHRVVAGAPVHMSFAKGSVSGTVYYWAMDEARLHRIPQGTTTNQAMFPGTIQGTATTDPGYQYSSCIACHQISRDGRYLAANGDQAYVFDLTSADPTQPNMPVATRAGYRWYFSTISPDNSRIFATKEDTSFGYTDLNVQDVTPTGTVPVTNLAHPSWSPDGKTVAFISNVQGWTTSASFTGGDLTLVDVDLMTDAFSGLRVIHTGASLMNFDPAGGTADCFPTWTPDSKFIMFAHTSNTRGTGETRLDGSLYIIPPMVNGAPVRLGIASDSAGHAQSHYPNTSPFISGGNYWIVFYSTRDYGNAQAGTKGTGRPQLWVSAISTTFNGTSDPSNVPYWLPGQSTAHENADAVWAASACKLVEGSCQTSSDCCSGTCQATADGGLSCAPAAVCRREGENCATDSDCCQGEGLVCDPTIHTCQIGIN